MEVDEIYNILRETFHSQSGLFLNKGQAYEVAQIIKEKSMISEMQRSVNFEREDHPYSAEVVHGVNKTKEK
jgi:hypothetical protein